MNSKIFTTLALLKVNSDRGFDYINNFVLLVVHVLKLKNYPEVNAENLIKDFEEEYGLIIPFHGMITIINRCRKDGYIYTADHKYYINQEKVIEDDFSSESKLQQTKIGELVESFKNFVLALEIDFLEPTKEECEDALISFIRDHSSEILISAEDSSTIPDVPTDQKLLYLLNKYIEKISKENASQFEYLIDLSFGQVLADTIVCEEFNSYLYNLNNLNCYLDTNIIFNLLGADGSVKEIAYGQFLETLTQSGAKLFIFQHTYEEIMGILEGCLKWLENPQFDPDKASRIMLFFVTNNKNKSDIELFISQVDSILSKFNINTKEKPHHDSITRDYEIDEAKLEQRIMESYGLSNSVEEIINKGTIRRDIDSISAICRLRRGLIAKSLKSAAYIFITTNSSLVHAVHTLEKEYLDTFNISPCLTDVFVGTILWICNPQKYREINKIKLLSDVSAAIQPNKNLIKRYLLEINKLKENKNITNDQYFLLRDKTTAINLLGERTFNNTENFSGKTPKEILSELQSKEAISERERHIKTKIELENKNKENAILTARNKFLSKKISSISSFLAKIFSYLITILAIPVVLISFFFYLFPENWKNNFFMNFALFCSILFTALCLIFGWSLRGFTKKNEGFSYVKIVKVLSK